MKKTRISLDQWRALQAVVDYDGYAQAAKQLHRSQSSISYAVNKLQQQLGIPLLRIEGRKAVLTTAGEVLTKRSRQLLKDAVELETLALNLERGWEAEIQLVIDAAFPSKRLMTSLRLFAPESRGTRVQMDEVVLSGADDALLEGRADLVICGNVPKGFLGDQLIDVEFIAIAHRDHKLHKLAEQQNRKLTHDDLRHEIQVVIRDSGVNMKRDVGWLGSAQRWTVTSLDKAADALVSGLGFGWLPRHLVAADLSSGLLKPLPLREGQRRRTSLFMVFGQPNNIGPATQKLADILHKCCSD